MADPEERPLAAPPRESLASFWSLQPEDGLRRLASGTRGLTREEAGRRLDLRGAAPSRRNGPLILLLTQFKSPILLILAAAAVQSAAAGQSADTSIILASGLIGFWQEQGAANAVEALLARVRVKATVLRDGSEIEVPVEAVVLGDLVVFNAGDIIPADCLLLEATDLQGSLVRVSSPVRRSR
jgi:Mg2+-importing ATPase